MTCVVGLEHDGICWLGGDSAVSWDDSRRICNIPKVFMGDGFVFGVAGDNRACDVIITHKHVPWRGEKQWEWAVNQWVPNLQKALKELEVFEVTMEVLLGAGGTLLYVGSDGGVHTFADGFGSIGSGGQVAIGALGSTKELSPQDRIERALSSAAAYTNYVAPPFKIVYG